MAADLTHQEKVQSRKALVRVLRKLSPVELALLDRAWLRMGYVEFAAHVHLAAHEAGEANEADRLGMAWWNSLGHDQRRAALDKAADVRGTHNVSAADAWLVAGKPQPLPVPKSPSDITARICPICSQTIGFNRAFYGSDAAPVHADCQDRAFELELRKLVSESCHA